MATRLEREIEREWNRYTHDVLGKALCEYGHIINNRMEKEARKIFKAYYADYPSPKVYDRTFKFQNQKISKIKPEVSRLYRGVVSTKVGIIVNEEEIKYEGAGISYEDIYKNTMYAGYHGTRWQAKYSTTRTSPSPYAQIIKFRNKLSIDLELGKYSKGLTGAFVRAIGRTSRAKYNLR